MHNNKIVGSINPTKIINTVFGGRKNNILIMELIKEISKTISMVIFISCIFLLYVLQ